MVCLTALLVDHFPTEVTASVPLVLGVTHENHRNSWISTKPQVFDYALSRERDHL